MDTHLSNRYDVPMFRMRLYDAQNYPDAVSDIDFGAKDREDRKSGIIPVLAVSLSKLSVSGAQSTERRTKFDNLEKVLKEQRSPWQLGQGEVYFIRGIISLSTVA